jgi:hypothetical protein
MFFFINFLSCRIKDRLCHQNKAFKPLSQIPDSKLETGNPDLPKTKNSHFVVRAKLFLKMNSEPKMKSCSTT